MSRRDEVAAFWDEVTRAFFAGEDRQTIPELRRWFGSYSGSGAGAVTMEAFAEPYIGPMATALGQPSMVFLGLNPGPADMTFQGREGLFRAPIEAEGFSRWAASSPYLTPPWSRVHPRNPYHRSRLEFARRWTGDASLPSSSLLILELYPWHSDRVTGVMRPPADLITRFVWEPLSELDAPIVFAFGKPWQAQAQALQLERLPVEVDFGVASRSLEVYRLPSGQRLAVVAQTGYAGPPGPTDTQALRAVLTDTSSGGGKAISRPIATPARPSDNERCLHELPQGTCASCSRKPVRRVSTSVKRGQLRDEYKHALAEAMTPGLRGIGLPAPRVTAGYLAVAWPKTLWYHQHTQQGDLHVFIYEDRIAVRVHIDTFPGDRAGNNAAMDILRSEIETDLVRALPESSSGLDWRDARGGNNQVCAVSLRGGRAANQIERDAGWATRVIAAWYTVLTAHSVDDLRASVQSELRR